LITNKNRNLHINKNIPKTKNWFVLERDIIIKNEHQELYLFFFDNIDTTIFLNKNISNDDVKIKNDVIEEFVLSCCKNEEVTCQLLCKLPKYDIETDLITLLAYCKFPDHHIQFEFYFTNVKENSPTSSIYCFASGNINTTDDHHSISDLKLNKPNILFLEQAIDCSKFGSKKLINNEECRNEIREIVNNYKMTCLLSFKDVVYDPHSNLIKIRAVCKHKTHDCSYKFVIQYCFQPDSILLGFTNGNPKTNHGDSIEFSHLSGERRLRAQQIMQNLAPGMLHEKMSQHVDTELAKKGNPQNWYKPETLQKANSERKCWEDVVKGCVVHAVVECVDEEKNKKHMDRYVQEASNPLKMVIFSKKQAKLLKKLTSGKKKVTFFNDATGTVIAKPRCHKRHTKKKVLYYAGVIQVGGVTLPLAEYITMNHDDASIGNFYSSYRKFLEVECRVKWPPFKTVVVDFSWAMLNGILRAFNVMDVITYVNLVHQHLTTKTEIPFEIVEIFICSSHFIKIIVGQINKKASNKISFKHMVLEAFALMIDCDDLVQLIIVFRHLMTIIISPKKNPAVVKSIIELKNIYTNYIQDEEMTEMLDAARTDDRISKKKYGPQPSFNKSQFYGLFSKIFLEVQEQVLDQNEKYGGESNPYYQKGFGAFLVKQYFAYVPLWTSIVTKKRLCNSPVENHFKTVKHQVIVEKSMPAHRFVSRTKDHFEARLKSIESGLFFKKV
jgi:hypothetical protein